MDLVLLPATPAVEPASVLCIAMGGFIDAGHTERLFAEHVLGAHESSIVGRFDVDQLIDYRGRRPIMTFDSDRFTGLDEPSLVLHRVLDRDGTPFLLLVGPEPDYQWSRMCATIEGLIAAFGVDLTISVHSIPMAVPHTRPTGCTVHGTNETLVGANRADLGSLRFPASFPAMLEYRLGQAGRDAIGFAVHVPHYLGNADYADAALHGIDRVMGATGLTLERTALVELAAEHQAGVQRQVAESAELTALVHALEEQVDAVTDGQPGTSLFPTDVSNLPSAEEIAEQFEDFLRHVNEDEDPPAV